MPLFNASAIASGTSSASSAAGVKTLASARFDGTSTLDWDYIQDAAAFITGGSPVTANAHVALSAIGVFQGSSAFYYIVPLVIGGSSLVSVAPVVDRHRRPIRAITMGPKRFSWMQLLQRGDLPVFICDAAGPFTPFSIEYRLVQVRLDGTLESVGPDARTPVQGVPGEFYATGRAGESGQPGSWLIEWSFQRTEHSEIQRTTMPFAVLDDVAVNFVRCRLNRRIKFGWS